jgi:hypothetical protein
MTNTSTLIFAAGEKDQLTELLHKKHSNTRSLKKVTDR